jgi:hypothetical protein
MNYLLFEYGKDVQQTMEEEEEEKKKDLKMSRLPLIFLLINCLGHHKVLLLIFYHLQQTPLIGHHHTKKGCKHSFTF